MDKEQIKQDEINDLACILDKAKIDARATLGSLNNGFGQWYAKAVYDAMYRKVDENAVVLTKQEYERLNKAEAELQELNAKYYNEAKDLRREVKQARKETAKEILQAMAKIMLEFVGNEPPCNFNDYDGYMIHNCEDYCAMNCDNPVVKKCWKEFLTAKLKENGVEVK